jgi:hypothetical protein
MIEIFSLEFKYNKDEWVVVLFKNRGWEWLTRL